MSEKKKDSKPLKGLDVVYVVCMIILIVAAICFLVASICLACKTKENTRAVIASALGGGVSLFSSVGLGVLAFWQNKRYKDLSEEKDKKSEEENQKYRNIMLLKEFSPKAILKQVLSAEYRKAKFALEVQEKMFLCNNHENNDALAIMNCIYAVNDNADIINVFSVSLELVDVNRGDIHINPRTVFLRKKIYYSTKNSIVRDGDKSDCFYVCLDDAEFGAYFRGETKEQLLAVKMEYEVINFTANIKTDYQALFKLECIREEKGEGMSYRIYKDHVGILCGGSRIITEEEYKKAESEYRIFRYPSKEL